MTDDDIKRARVLVSDLQRSSLFQTRLAGDTITALLAERDALARDAARFDWYFGRTDKIDFMQTYLTGMKDGWTPDQWRAAIDAAMKGASDE